MASVYNNIAGYSFTESHLIGSKSHFPPSERYSIDLEKSRGMGISQEENAKLVNLRERLISKNIRNQSLTLEQITERRRKEIERKLHSLSQEYTIGNISLIKSFLLRNFFVLPILEEIPNKLAEYFGAYQQLILKTSNEGDSTHSNELWIYLVTPLPAKEALLILDKFDEDWWFENTEKTNHNLNVTLKFI